MEERIKPDAYYYPRTALVALENTHNRAGGRVFVQAEAAAIAARAHERGLAVHLDGARIWNASVATGRSVADLSAPFDTVSVCFSKGLGAPVGSALAGTAAVVDRARRFRKMWGGGMRQVGVLAAAARYALAHHRARLAEDHDNARELARLLTSPAVVVDVARVETNIVNIDVPGVSADSLSVAARAAGVLLNATGPHRLRAVTHLDLSRDDVRLAAQILERVIADAKTAR
jgi:threonine aldolase